MKTPIDLGRKSDFSPVETLTNSTKEPSVYYPEFQYSGDKELDLPDEGVMEIRFRKVREVEEKRGDTEHYTCTIEVCEILEVEGDEEVEAPTKSGTEAGVALDDLARKLISLHDILEKTD